MTAAIQAQLINVLIMLACVHVVAHFIQKFTGIKAHKALLKAEKKLLKLAGKAIWSIITWPFRLLKPRAKAASGTTRRRLWP